MVAQRQPYPLDLSGIPTSALGRIAADLEAARLKAVRRNRAGGGPIQDEVTDFLDQVARLVYAESAYRDKAVCAAEQGAG